MPGDVDDVLSDAHRHRHQLLSSLTVIYTQAQMLQRQLRRMDGFADGDRQHLEAGLAVILTAARALSSSVTQLPGIREDRGAS